MAWGIGANDVANAMGTSVGSKALTLRQAIIIAALFECTGAFLAGGQVTQTIRKGIINPLAFSHTPHLLVLGMMASLLAAGTWLLVASYKGWPVSTTHSIIGAIIGFAVLELGVDAVQWMQVLSIVGSWVITPVISGGIGFVIIHSIQKFIINTDDPNLNAKRYLPLYIFCVAFVMALVTLFKGLKHIGLDLPDWENYAFALGFGVLAMIIGYLALAFNEKRLRKKGRYGNVEAVFALLMIFTASAMAFAHGSNDVANAIGPLAAIVSIAKTADVAAAAYLPKWELLLGAIGILAGLAMYGYRVIGTIGEKITELTPSRGFAAEFATAITVVVASGTGLPISTTQTLVGAVLGVGLARSIGALNLKVIRGIFASWVVTLPAGALLSMFFFLILKTVL